MNNIKLFSYLFAAGFFIFAFLGFSAPAQAGTNDNVSGWGWSSTIGWISLNSSDDHNPNAVGVQADAVDYGVRVDTTQNPATQGAMSGYAWSPNIGWISFNVSDTASICPTSAAARINMTTGVMSGWARATAGTNASGWNGCISLSGSNPSYGPTMNTTTGALSGFAWGSTVVGWVQINAIVTLDPNQPTLSLVATPTTLANAGTTSLSWIGANVQTSSCFAPWTAQTGSTGTEPAVPVSTTTTFTITCQGNNNAPITATATVTVTSSTSLVLQANPTAVQTSNLFTNLMWTSPTQTNFTSCSASASSPIPGWNGTINTAYVPNVTNGYTHQLNNVAVSGSAFSTTYTLNCVDAAGNHAIATAIVTSFAPTPSVTLSAQPGALPQGGGSSTLTWTSANVTACSASANPSGWGNPIGTNGSAAVQVTTTTQYTITCQSSYAPPQVIASTTVYVAGTAPCSTCVPQGPPKPVFEEF